jgi:hypothetical protein
MRFAFPFEQPLKVTGKAEEHFTVNQISRLENTYLINRF